MQASISAPGKRRHRPTRSVGLAVPVLAAIASLLPVSPAGAADAAVCAVAPQDSRLVVHVGTGGLLKFAGHEHTVTIPVHDGRVQADQDDPGRSKVELGFAIAEAVVSAEKEAEDAPKVQEKMRGPDVLDVGHFPKAQFVSSQVTAQRASDSRWKATLEGTLTLHGQSRPVKLEVEVERSGGRLVAEARFHLRQTDFGIEPVSVGGVVKVKNELELEAHIVASCPGP